MKQSNVKEYFKPESLEEAISTLSNYEGNIKVIAGATDLYTDDHKDIDALLDIAKLGLNYIKEEEGFIKIGAATTIKELRKSDIIKTKFQSLWEASKVFADYTLINKATIGGNICSALPSSDTIPPISSMNAVYVINTPSGEKKVDMDEFIISAKCNILKRDEILTEIQIPICHGYYGTSFEKASRNSEDLALVNAAAFIEVDQENKVKKAKITIGSVGTKAVRPKEFEEALIGLKLEDNDNLDKLTELVLGSISPRSSVRTTKEYRTHMSKVFAKRTALKAYQRAVENK